MSILDVLSTSVCWQVRQEVGLAVIAEWSVKMITFLPDRCPSMCGIFFRVQIKAATSNSVGQ